MQKQERVQTVYPVDLNGLCPATGVPLTFSDMTFINTYPDPAAGMEVMFWRDIRAKFSDAAYVRHDSRTLAFLKDAEGNVPIFIVGSLAPLRVAALHRAVLEIIVDAPLSTPADHTQSRITKPPTPRPIPPTATYQRPPPILPLIVPRPPPILPLIVPRPPIIHVVQQPPRSTARSAISKIASRVNLELLQEQGEGDKKDFSKALKCYLKAVNKSHAHAQFAVGKLYFDGKDVLRDHKKASEWMTKAADQGHVEAQISLGNYYRLGLDVPQDYQEAFSWYFKAAEQGNGDAQYELGLMYYEGRGVAEDFSRSLEWVKKAADQGNIGALSHIWTV
ncbi:hypothetical protein EC991_001766 [Linnemannia zychae]|nr:hypothetical protein EC991_001766 [Linnemannia zychae]